MEVAAKITKDMGFKALPVKLVQFSAILDGLLLVPLQAIRVVIGLFVVMPVLLSKEAFEFLKPDRIFVFAVGLIIAFLVFGYFRVFQIPTIF